MVWAIGNQTETGRIARLICEAVDLSTPLPADSWLWIVAVAFVAYVVVGVEKWIRLRWAKAAGNAELAHNPSTSNLRTCA